MAGVSGLGVLLAWAYYAMFNNGAGRHDMILLAGVILAFGLICLFKPNGLRAWGDHFPWSSAQVWKQRRLPPETWLAITRTFGTVLVIIGIVALALTLGGYFKL